MKTPMTLNDDNWKQELSAALSHDEGIVIIETPDERCGKESHLDYTINGGVMVHHAETYEAGKNVAVHESIPSEMICNILGRETMLVYDSGSCHNIIHEQFCKQLGVAEGGIRRISAIVAGSTGHSLGIIGEIELPVQHGT